MSRQNDGPFDKVSPASNTVDGSKIRGSPVDMENLSLFTWFWIHLRWLYNGISEQQYEGFASTFLVPIAEFSGGAWKKVSRSSGRAESQNQGKVVSAR